MNKTLCLITVVLLANGSVLLFVKRLTNFKFGRCLQGRYERGDRSCLHSRDKKMYKLRYYRRYFRRFFCLNLQEPSCTLCDLH